MTHLVIEHPRGGGTLFVSQASVASVLAALQIPDDVSLLDAAELDGAVKRCDDAIATLAFLETCPVADIPATPEAASHPVVAPVDLSYIDGITNFPSLASLTFGHSADADNQAEPILIDELDRSNPLHWLYSPSAALPVPTFHQLQTHCSSLSLASVSSAPTSSTSLSTSTTLTSLCSHADQESHLGIPVREGMFETCSIWSATTPSDAGSDETSDAESQGPTGQPGTLPSPANPTIDVVRARALPADPADMNPSRKPVSPREPRERQLEPGVIYYTGSIKSSMQRPARRLLDPELPMHKHLPYPPCNKHYSRDAGCEELDCQYGHDYLLTADEIQHLRINMRKSPCPKLKRGQSCDAGEEGCVAGHFCPYGRECRYGADCVFLALPDAHARDPIVACPTRHADLVPFRADERVQKLAAQARCELLRQTQYHKQLRAWELERSPRHFLAAHHPNFDAGARSAPSGDHACLQQPLMLPFPQQQPPVHLQQPRHAQRQEQPVDFIRWTDMPARLHDPTSSEQYAMGRLRQSSVGTHTSMVAAGQAGREAGAGGNQSSDGPPVVKLGSSAPRAKSEERFSKQRASRHALSVSQNGTAVPSERGRKKQTGRKAGSA